MNKKQAFNIYMNKKQATKWALSKDNPNREKNKLQGGWTEEAKDGAKAAAALGHELSDLYKK